VLAHQLWLVVRVDPSSEEDDDDVSSLEDEESSEAVVDVSVVVVVWAVVVVSAPIEPSNAITPQASANDASTAATTRCRIVAIRRARAARSSWAEGMSTMLGAVAEGALGEA
jgi:hypothetical protein